jgi:sulfite oxidase
VAIQQVPIISAICEPADMTELPEDVDWITIQGYAYSGGGRAIIRVDVSIDNGETWEEACLKPPKKLSYSSYGWTLFEKKVKVPEDAPFQLEIVCKAVDVSYNVQPDTIDGIWNLRGLLNNAWHTVTCFIKGRDSPEYKLQQEAKALGYKK